MSFFEHVQHEPPDSILGLNATFNEDKRHNKVNLGAGVYKTADLSPLILNSVKKAESLLLDNETSKDYLPIDGLKDYVQLTRKLICPESENVKNIYGAQTPGGTAALRIGGAFLKEIGMSRIYLSTPTWTNHNLIFKHAGLEIYTYPYFNRETGNLDFEGMIRVMETMSKGSIIVLQASCHNPTGLDPSLDQWKEIFRVVKQKKIFPFFDLAYQGFGDGIDKDTASLSLFLHSGLECAIAVSHSKNFGIYAERCGALYLVCSNEQEVQRVGSRINVIIRGLYSNPPCHGARAVSSILTNKELTALWKEELAGMRARIVETRIALKEGLQKKCSSPLCEWIGNQKGMFSYTGLSEKQVERLISEYGIYMPKDGRINVAGLNSTNLNYVINAIVAVILD